MSTKTGKEIGDSVISDPDAKPIIVGKVKISHKANPDLYEFLSPFGRYYWTKQLVRLALKGLALEQGTIGVVATVSSDNQAAKQTIPVEKQSSGQPSAEPKDNEHISDTKYSIPSDAADALDGLFDSF